MGNNTRQRGLVVFAIRKVGGAFGQSSDFDQDPPAGLCETPTHKPHLDCPSRNLIPGHDTSYDLWNQRLDLIQNLYITS
jgi:hypothetical protein